MQRLPDCLIVQPEVQPLRQCETVMLGQQARLVHLVAHEKHLWAALRAGRLPLAVQVGARLRQRGLALSPAIWRSTPRACLHAYNVFTACD